MYSTKPKTILVLPGTGFDGIFAAQAFSPLSSLYSIPVHGHTPDTRDVALSYQQALYQACQNPPVLAVGFSLGAHVLADFVIHNDQTLFYQLILALPAWVQGEAEESNAKYASRVQREKLMTTPLNAVCEHLIDTVPIWLAHVLQRSWTWFGDGLSDFFWQSEQYTGPTEENLKNIHVPSTIIGAKNDPLHAFCVAQRWQKLIPSAQLCTLTYEEDFVPRRFGETVIEHVRN